VTVDNSKDLKVAVGEDRSLQGSVTRNPGFSKSKDMNIMSVSQVSNSSIVKRVSKRSDVESAHIEGRDMRRNMRSRARIRLNIPSK
jgi:hypothetical protein